MKVALWGKTEEAQMDRHARAKLVDEVERDLGLPRTATYQDACRRVCEVISRRLKHPVELQFVTLRNPRISGATALRVDGTYVIYVAESPFWYHRLQILLHEFAHLLLGHNPVPLSTSEGLRRFLPHLPAKLGDILATRAGLCRGDELDAEDLADDLLGRLTERLQLIDGALPDVPEHVRRLADTLDHQTGRRTS